MLLKTLQKNEHSGPYKTLIQRYWFYKTDFWTLWEKARVGCFKRAACILSIMKQITSPGGMHETSAWAWCTGKTQRDRVEREMGGGIRMGNTCNSMADSCQCMTKPTEMLWSNQPPTNKKIKNKNILLQQLTCWEKKKNRQHITKASCSFGIYLNLPGLWRGRAWGKTTNSEFQGWLIYQGDF